MTKQSVKQAEAAARTSRVVAAYSSGERPASIAKRERVHVGTVYKDLRGAGVFASRNKCARDGNPGRPPRVVVDGKSYLYCESCKTRMLTYVGVELEGTA